jgi:tetratricopeptide (TPR) repeat protein
LPIWHHLAIISTTRNQSCFGRAACRIIDATPNNQKLVILAVFCLLVPWQLASAHGDLEEQIDAITAEIRKQPTNAVLYLRRGELHRLHKEAAEALADYAEAARLKPDSVMPALYRAQLFSDIGRTQDAIAEANSVLKREPLLPEALVIRARCRVKLGAIQEAVPDLSAALGKWTAPQPELYLELAQLQASLGHLDDAVKGLEAGMSKIGETPPLQMAAIQYERQQAKFDAALARVEKIAQKYSVKESWLLLRGEILAQAGRAVEARVAFNAVLADLEKYPSARRNLDQTKQLEARARDALAHAETKLAQSSR